MAKYALKQKVWALFRNQAYPVEIVQIQSKIEGAQQEYGVSPSVFEETLYGRDVRKMFFKEEDLIEDLENYQKTQNKMKDVMLKYTYKDRVWYMWNDKPREGEVSRVEISINELVRVTYFLSGEERSPYGYIEDKLFPTKQGLLNSL